MKIGLCGTMSVGKTTLVNALKETEQFKDYMFRTERSKFLMEQGIPLNTDSTLKGQTVFLAERCAELIQPNIITDRTVIDVMAFTMNAKSIAYQDKEAFEEYAKEFIREYDYIFYTDNTFCVNSPKSGLGFDELCWGLGWILLHGSIIYNTEKQILKCSN